MPITCEEFWQLGQRLLDLNKEQEEAYFEHKETCRICGALVDIEDEAFARSLQRKIWEETVIAILQARKYEDLDPGFRKLLDEGLAGQRRLSTLKMLILYSRRPR